MRILELLQIFNTLHIEKHALSWGFYKMTENSLKQSKRVESVNVDAEAFGDDSKILIALYIVKLKQ